MKTETVKELQQALEEQMTLKESLSAKMVAFEEENAVTISALKEQATRVESIKEIIRTDALKEFGETGEKKFVGGIGIREITELVYETEKAIDWCRENMPVAVVERLEKKTFDSFAKNNDVPIVTRKKIAAVTFPKNIILGGE